MPSATPEMISVPLFPLPGVVLFPGSVMPLRVFEPRYLKMLQDAMNSERRIGMAFLLDAAAEPAGSLITTLPPVHDVLGVGRVMGHELQADGTANIALMGEVRGRIVEELPHQPYRIARVAVLRDELPRTPELKKHLQRSTQELLDAAHKLIKRTLQHDGATQLEAMLKERTESGPITDLLASVYVHHPELKQMLLEEADVLKRTQLLAKIAEKLLQAMEPKPPQTPYGSKDYSLN